MFINNINLNTFKKIPNNRNSVSFSSASSLKEDCLEISTVKKDVCYKKIKKLAFKDPARFRLIKSAINSTKIGLGVSENTLMDFVDEMINLKDTTTLKKALDAKVKFKLVVSDEPSSYSIYISKDFPTTKEIKICQKPDGTNLAYQLPHELGHVFDYETQINKSNLTSNLEFGLIKDKNGYRKSDKFLPNTRKIYIDNYEKNSSKIKYKDTILQNASFSKEFEDAFLKDYINMLEIDKTQGDEEGTTFNNLLSDWMENSYFGYYLGAKEHESEIEDASRLKKELFAQLSAFSVNGHTSRKGFDKKVLLYFPNTFHFIDNLIKSST